VEKSKEISFEGRFIARSLSSPDSFYDMAKIKKL
jgi:hypothetical protein